MDGRKGEKRERGGQRKEQGSEREEEGAILSHAVWLFLTPEADFILFTFLNYLRIKILIYSVCVSCTCAHACTFLHTMAHM